MSNNVYKVSTIEENGYNIDSNRLLNTLVLNYANPLVSVPFVSKAEDSEKIKDLSKRAKINYKDGCFYDIEGNLITKDVMALGISADLCSSSKVFLESEEDKIYQANMVKFILEKKLLPKIQKTDESNVLTVDDLVAKLYNVSEEKGSMMR